VPVVAISGWAGRAAVAPFKGRSAGPGGLGQPQSQPRSGVLCLHEQAAQSSLARVLCLHEQAAQSSLARVLCLHEQAAQSSLARVPGSSSFEWSNGTLCPFRGDGCLSPLNFQKYGKYFLNQSHPYSPEPRVALLNLLPYMRAGAAVRDFGQASLKDVERELFQPTHSVSPWFTLDTKLGERVGHT
jgi:hypothetical protein